VVLHEDFSGEEFLQWITEEPSARAKMRGCAMVRQHQPLSRNPLDLSHRTLQGDRRLMLQHRLLVCLPVAVKEAERALESRPDLDAETMKRAQRAIGTAKGWWARSNTRYVNGVVGVLESATARAYGLGPGGYPWTYPGTAAARVRQGLRVAFGEVTDAPVSLGTQLFLEPTRRRTPRNGKLGDLVRTGNVFFASTISPEARDRLLEMEALHHEAGQSVLCKAQQIGLQNPGWCPGMRPAPDVLVEYRTKMLDGVVRLGLPVIAPFARGTDPDLTFEELCSITQRKALSHRLWTLGVLDGHTPEGFRQAWVAMLAHAIIHAEALLGERVPGADKLKPSVRSIVNAHVPGVHHGQCDVDHATMDGVAISIAE
jgi:hypothetical protein